MATPKTNSFKRVLRTAGRRVTGQRELLLEVIQEHQGHLDAQELYQLARQRDPRLSLSTVYRTMSLLRDLGMVDEVHLGEEHHHYELKTKVAHHHLVCLGCGKVEEFESPLAERLEVAVALEYDFEMRETRIELSGYCAECRQARRKDAEPEHSRAQT